jgi:hypothetical protein
MSFLLLKDQMYLTFKVLEVSAMYFNSGQSLLNLLLKFMKIFYLVMTQTLVHIVFSTRTPVVLKSHVMRYLMRLIAPKWSNLILILQMMKFHVMPCKGCPLVL